MASLEVVQVSTQEANPGRAAKRTALQVGTAALALLVLAPTVIQAILDGLGETLPEGIRIWLAGAAVAITAVATTIARIMAIPGVIEWTKKYAAFLSPDETPARHRA